MKRTYGYTLIELIIVITIIFFLWAGISYHYIQQARIQDVRTSVRIISQSISEARNLARNGFEKNGKNQHVGIYLDTTNPEEIIFFSFPYDVSTPTIDEWFILKNRPLKKNITFHIASWKESLFILFESITGKSTLYSKEGGRLVPFSIDKVDIDIQYKHAPYFPLKQRLTFYPQTNISDYSSKE